MEHIDLFQVIAEVFSFIGTQDAHCQTHDGPNMHHLVAGAVMFAEFVNLGVAVMASGDTIAGLGVLNLAILEATVLQALILETGLEKTAAAAAAIIVGTVRNHVYEVFLAHKSFHHKAQVFGNGVAKGFTHDLTWVLSGELNLQVLVPIGIDLELALANPFGVVFINIFNFKVMLDVEFFQSCQD